MAKLKKYFRAVKYHITEGWQPQWQCWADVRAIEASNDKWGATVYFSVDTSEIVQLEVFDYAKDRAWRWQESSLEKEYKLEASRRQVNPDEAWDHVVFKPASLKKLFKRIRSLRKEYN
jgi:hypothetical protein